VRDIFLFLDPLRRDRSGLMTAREFRIGAYLISHRERQFSGAASGQKFHQLRFPDVEFDPLSTFPGI
jgi:hypothetical protein